MAVSSSLARTAPSVKFSPRFGLVEINRIGGSRIELSFANVNGIRTSTSEKVHLDEIAVTLGQGGAA
jgi:hypothetical protein